MPTTSQSTSNAPYHRLNGHQRKLSDYCSIFAEKTNRIGRNVENFMHSRGFFTARRSTDESSRGSGSITRSNGDVVRMSPARPTRIDDSQRYSLPSRRYEESPRYEATARRYEERQSLPICARNSYPRASSSESSYIERPLELEPRRASRRDYSMTYEDRLAWREVSRELSTSKPILRNGINQGRIERPYSCTLPRRSRTINFRDQAESALDSRSRGYPKSLQDLTDLEIDDRSRDPPVSSLLAGARPWASDRLDDSGYRRRRHLDEETADDGYLRLYRNLSRLDKYPQGGRFEPGQVHYERECRTFGKDTVAFIYYKTCYL